MSDDPIRALLVDVAERAAEAAAERVRDDLAAALDAATHAEPRPLLDRAGLARALAVSVPTVDRLRREPSFPEYAIGDARRFDVREVRQWLRARRCAASGLTAIDGGKR